MTKMMAPQTRQRSTWMTATANVSLATKGRKLSIYLTEIVKIVKLKSSIELAFLLWKDDASPDDDVAMNAEPALDFGDYRQQPVLRMLYEAFNSADEVRSINLLHSGLLNTVNLEDFGGVINYLCYLALSPAYGDLGSAAFKALLNVWTTSRNRTPGVTLKSVLTAVSGLGARSELLKLNRGKLPTLDHQRRESLVFRLLKLTGVSARLLIPDEMPEILLVLLAIALDSSTSVAIQQEIAIVLNAIFQSIADPNVVAEIEPVICTKIVSFISKIDVANIAYIVNVLAGGPGRGTRVARWVARCVLLGKTRVTEAEYCHTPSIDSLSAILIQGAKTSCQAFQDKKGTDYIAMGYYTQILAIALTDIPNYMPQEIAAAAAFKAENSVQNSPSKEKFETPLQHLHSCIIFLHRKITDHGSNIERSRTKAALLTLAMRLHFQLTAGSRKPSNIQAYLIKKEKGN
ncbi:hypothetical protein BT96DRAFT_11728 [Gymnopus androsaceus JB14]|uniref:Uncharacterized protein n=1 Tax=Gymnopus androsaceus JB14 TaxID=1447944 RepID=A0A6A4IGE1_9AGAR|nr:hypothetical protein BT96DRAFT_11728 [Gymnopus androsaceus JB14]